jgi:hypothetical protein
VTELFGKLPGSLPLDALTRSFERSLLDQCGKAISAQRRAGRGYRLT